MKLIKYGLCVALLSLSATVTAMEWQWIDAMRVAVQEQSYEGEFIHQRGNTTRAYSIAHRFEQGRVKQLLRQLDGERIEVIREGDRLVCFYPAGSTVDLSAPVPAAPFAYASELDLPMISSNYSAMAQGQARVAGYDADIIVLMADEWRYSRRLWLEQDTHLLLQSQLLDASGKVIEQFRFTRLSIGEPISENALNPPTLKEGMRQQTVFSSPPESSMAKTLTTSISWLPNGYELYHSEHLMTERGWREKQTYVDGLSSFTVFVEHQEQTNEQPIAIAKMGATTALMSARAKHSISIIGEIPPETAKSIESGILFLAQAP